MTSQSLRVMSRNPPTEFCRKLDHQQTGEDEFFWRLWSRRSNVKILARRAMGGAFRRRNSVCLAAPPAGGAARHTDFPCRTAVSPVAVKDMTIRGMVLRN